MRSSEWPPQAWREFDQLNVDAATLVRRRAGLYDCELQDEYEGLAERFVSFALVWGDDTLRNAARAFEQVVMGRT